MWVVQNRAQLGGQFQFGHGEQVRQRSRLPDELVWMEIIHALETKLRRFARRPR